MFSRFVIIIALSLLCSCKPGVMRIKNPDPLERINKTTFRFNRIANAIINPYARAYQGYPMFVRDSVDNFLSNVTMPISAINAVLQKKPGLISLILWRFCINTVFGLFGILDPATKIGFKDPGITTEQTLAQFMHPGFFIIIPVLGPTHFRMFWGESVMYFAYRFASYILSAPFTLVPLANWFVKYSENAKSIDEIYKNDSDGYYTLSSMYGQHFGLSPKDEEDEW